jgi:hypothetical protein
MEFGTFGLTLNAGGPDLAIVEPGTVICDTIDGLDGMSGVTILARFAYGEGGTTVNAYVQTSFDQGSSWCDIACFSFDILSGALVVNLSAITPVISPLTPGDGILADNTALSGPLGDRLRCKVVITGTYGGSSLLAVRATVR